MSTSPNLLSVTRVRDLARRHGIRPSRSLGQNFMVDPNAIRRVVRLAEIEPQDRIIEVGAGLGTFTIALSAAARSVVAVEIDRRITPALREAVEGLENVTVVEQDALELDFSAVTGGRPHKMVSNLPYNIATPLIAKLLEAAPEVTDFSIVVQREAGERFVAPPGSRVYGAISVMVAYYCEGRIAGKVPGTVFWPQPKVESVIVRLTRRAPPVQVDAGALRSVTRAAFAQRRKTLRNTLSSGFSIVASDAAEWITSAGLDPGARAEILSLEDFASLTNAGLQAGIVARTLENPSSSGFDPGPGTS